MISCEHAIPGRLRLKAGTPSPELLRSLRQSLLALPGIRSVEARPATGSLIIQHDASISQEQILAHAGADSRCATRTDDTRAGHLEETLASLLVEAAMEHVLGKPAMTLLKTIL